MFNVVFCFCEEENLMLRTLVIVLQSVILFDALESSSTLNQLHFWSNISNTRKSVSSDIQTLRSGLKKRGAAEFF